MEDTGWGAPDEAAGDGGAARVLAVEDNPSTLEFIRFTLEDEGFEVAGAPNAQTALSMLCDRDFDVVLLDLVLPDMGGLDLAERIRSLLGDKSVPIIAFTGAVPDDHRRDPSSGPLDHILLKPADPQQLVETIEDHLESRSGPVPRPGEGLRIVQIGSDPARHEAVTLRLRRLGFEVDRYFDAEPALQAALERPPAAVVADVLAPGMSGFEVCLKIRTAEGLEETPVVLVTSFATDADDSANARRFGASGFVTLSSDLEQLGDELLRSISEPPPPVETTASTELEHLDWFHRALARGEADGTRSIRDAEIRAGQMEILEQLTEIVSTTTQLRRVFEESLAETLHLLAAYRGAVYLWDGGDLVIETSLGDGWEPRIALGPPRGAIKEAMAGRASVIDGGDLEESSPFRALKSDRWVAVGPIASGGEPLGLMLVGSMRDELRPSGSFLEALGLQLGLAVRLDRAQHRLETSEEIERRDPVTGLATAVVLEERLASMVAEMSREGGTGALVLAGIHKFWQVRSSFGARGVAEVLRHLAERISSFLHPSYTLASLGADRFAILAPSTAVGSSDAVALGRRLLAAVAEPFQVEGRDVYLSACVGISVFPDDDADAARSLGQAEAALHRARELGGNTLEIYGPDWGGEAADRVTLGNELRSSMGGGLVLQYQPFFRLPELAPRGAEALLRWEHPTRGMLFPDRFIPIAEESGLIIQMGEWVLRSVCEQAHFWNSNGSIPKKVAFNVGARQLYEGDLPAAVSRVVTETAIDPDLLELEVTESVAMRDLDHSARVLAEIQEMGLTISLDDFGTGHSSLAYLRDLPVDIVKIDQSFVSGRTDASNAAIVSATVALAHSLGMSCVGEGVETSDQLEMLIGAGCDYAQGFLLGMPGPAPEVSRALDGTA